MGNRSINWPEDSDIVFLCEEYGKDAFAHALGVSYMQVCRVYNRIKESGSSKSKRYTLMTYLREMPTDEFLSAYNSGKTIDEVCDLLYLARNTRNRKLVLGRIKEIIQMNMNRIFTGYVGDASSSMGGLTQSVKSSIENTIVEYQKSGAQVTFTMMFFDTSFTYACTNKDIQEVDAKKIAAQYRASGMTALHDAIADCVERSHRHLQSLDRTERPARVIFYVHTDGEENASREYRNPRKIADFINYYESVFGYEFVFIGQGIDAAKSASTLGIGQHIQADSSDEGQRAYMSATVQYAVTGSSSMIKSSDSTISS